MAAFAARRVRESGSNVSQGDDTSAISATERQGGTGVAALCVSSADVHRLLMLCATASNAAESSLNVHTIQSSIVIASAGQLEERPAAHKLQEMRGVVYSEEK